MRATDIAVGEKICCRSKYLKPLEHSIDLTWFSISLVFSIITNKSLTYSYSLGIYKCPKQPADLAYSSIRSIWIHHHLTFFSKADLVFRTSWNSLCTLCTQIHHLPAEYWDNPSQTLMVILLFSLISLLTNLFSSSSSMVTIVAEWSVEGKQALN